MSHPMLTGPNYHLNNLINYQTLYAVIGYMKTVSSVNYQFLQNDAIQLFSQMGNRNIIKFFSNLTLI